MRPTTSQQPTFGSLGKNIFKNLNANLYSISNSRYSPLLPHAETTEKIGVSTPI
jgi:hypothetical protein